MTVFLSYAHRNQAGGQATWACRLSEPAPGMAPGADPVAGVEQRVDGVLVRRSVARESTDEALFSCITRSRQKDMIYRT
jgi:hypothetical protein